MLPQAKLTGTYGVEALVVIVLKPNLNALAASMESSSVTSLLHEIALLRHLS